MKEFPPLSAMKSEDKDALIHELWDKNKALEAELAKYKKRVRKTSENSSVPPSKDYKKKVEPSPKEQGLSKKKHTRGG